jgi:hypothetical protein
MSHRIRLLPLLLLAAAAHPALGQIQEDRREELASARQLEPGPPRRGCHTLREPRLPSLSALVDSASLAARLAELAAAYPIAGDSTPFGLYSVKIGLDGGVADFRPLAWLLPEGQVGVIHQTVRASLAPRALAPGAVRLRVLLGSAPGVRVEFSQRCPAEVRTRFQLRTNALGSATLQRPQPVRVRVQVAETGRVLGVQLLGTTGIEEVDRWVQDALQRGNAVPGLIDGIPTQMEVDALIQVETR